MPPPPASEASKKRKRADAELAAPSSSSGVKTPVPGMPEFERHHESTIPARLAVGARVEHPLRGLGTVSSHQASDPCKVFVAFDNGESHGYREHSWPKLNPPGSMPHAPLFPPTGDSIRVE